MENVKISQLGSQKGKYFFAVDIGGDIYKISLGRDYWLALTDGSQPASQLVLDSVMFLLACEPKEKILKEFDLEDIKKYFPKFEEFIKN